MTYAQWASELDDYAGGPRPHGYPTYRGYVKLCPDDCPHCPRQPTTAELCGPGAYSNEYD